MAFSESFDIGNSILKLIDGDFSQKDKSSKLFKSSGQKLNKTIQGKYSFDKILSHAKTTEGKILHDCSYGNISEFFASELSFQRDVTILKDESKLKQCVNISNRTSINLDLNLDGLNGNEVKDENNIDIVAESTLNNSRTDINLINISQISNFINFIDDSNENRTFLIRELEESKKNLSILQGEEIFSKFSFNEGNLSTSEKPLLHFSLSSEESFKEENNSNIEINDKNISNNCTPKSFKKSLLNDELNVTAKVNIKNHSNALSEWGLPPRMLLEYNRKGITTLFDWQVDCLKNAKVLLEIKNFVYSAPTSAGKTLISEIIAVKTILERNKKVIFILPFIAVVREKMLYLQDLLSSSGYRAEGFYGGYSPPGGFDAINLAICTIEKANSIINNLMEQRKLENLGCIIIDEIHLISEPGRGYILELLLAKVIYMSKLLNHKIQIVTMSATLPNCELLTDWLNAELYVTNFRPVELKEMIKIGNKIYDNHFELVRTIQPFPDTEIQNDQDDIVLLCLETILDGCSVIIFCPSKDWCENLSQNLAKCIKNICEAKTDMGSKILKLINEENLLKVKKQLHSLETGFDKILANTCEYGCAFHHAGLTTEERDVVESAFKIGYLKIIVATSTLSSGVNLPARRVIIRSPMFGGKIMDSVTYRQMIGRAGRTGQDDLGESILICNESCKKFGNALIKTALKPILSCLDHDNAIHLKRALLEVISSGVANSRSELIRFLNCTLLAHSSKSNDNILKIMHYFDDCINFLTEYEFIRSQEKDDAEVIYIPSRLGVACLASSLPPTDGIILLSELQKSRKCFVLESELHAVYLVVPYSVTYQLQTLDWLHYLDIWERLTPGMKRVAEIVGVKESFIVRAMRFENKLDYKLLQVHKRFYTALALQELVNEVPMTIVANKYKCNRGLLQTLQQMSSTFASIVSSFCNALNWKTLGLIVSQFKERLYFGVHHDLIDLMRLSEMNTQKARALYNAGIESVIALANSNISRVEKILYDNLTFESIKKQENEDEYEVKKRIALRNIQVTGKSNMTLKDTAQILVSSAREFLQFEMGVKCDWSNKDENKNIESSTFNEKILKGKTNESNRSISNSSNLDTREKVSLDNSNQISYITNKDFVQDPQKLNHLISSCANLSIEESNGIEIILIKDFIENLENVETILSNLINAKVFGCSLGIEKLDSPVKSMPKIGENVLSTNKVEKKSMSSTNFIIEDKYYINGVSLSFEDNVSVFVNLQCKNEVLEFTLRFLKSVFSIEDISVRIYNAKEQIKILEKFIIKDYELKNKIEDPRIAHWLLNPDEEPNIKNMVSEYLPKFRFLLENIDNFKGYQSLGLFYNSPASGRIRASYEAYITNQILKEQVEKLDKKGDGQIKKFFYELEMPIQKVLAHSEVIGISVSERKMLELSNIMQETMKKLEKKIYEMNGVRFNLKSTTAVARVLGLQRNNYGKISTSKQILERLDSPLSNLILNHRKVSTVLSKNIQQLQKCITNNKIHGNSITLTSSGRISMHEPNLQNVAKDFNVIMGDMVIKISCRSIFLCPEKRCLLSADFCQLEMRILAHLSQDENLKSAVESDQDIFTAISANWNKIPIAQVSEQLRNGTKQICYGIIYGMGAKALSENLKCTEQEAICLSEEFHKAYPGIRAYIKKIVKFAKRNGFIETITGRRRYLEHINSSKNSLRNQAERRSVNSAIQGSAADILKSAILRMEKNIKKYKKKLCVNLPNDINSSLQLVLHLHDELIYEIPEEKVRNVGKVLKTAMENCVKLSVPLKVKIKSGKSWGEMIYLDI